MQIAYQPECESQREERRSRSRIRIGAVNHSGRVLEGTGPSSLVVKASTLDAFVELSGVEITNKLRVDLLDITAVKPGVQLLQLTWGKLTNRAFNILKSHHEPSSKSRLSRSARLLN